MKKLFAVLLVVAMVLSLGVTAFAADEKITVTNPPVGVRYRAIKVFAVATTTDATTGETTLTYTIAEDSPFYNTVKAYAGLKLIEVSPATTPKTYQVEKLVSFSAADFAAQLATVANTLDADKFTYDSGIFTAAGYAKSGDIEIPVEDTGYFLIQSASGSLYDNTDQNTADNKGVDGIPGSYSTAFNTSEIQATAALTTVLEGKTVQIQNKNDMPLDKTVKKDGQDVENKGVQVGDTLNFQIDTKVPELDPNKQAYIFKITDAMTDGLTFGNKLTIAVGGDTFEITFIPKDASASETTANRDHITVVKKGTPDVNVTSYFELITDPDDELTGNQVRFGKNGKTFELSLDVSSGTGTETSFEGSFRMYHGKSMTIKYDATVNESAIAEVLENKVVLAYGEDNEHLTVKDDSTKNYLSKIVIDKFAEGNNTQKLEGAEFVLYRRNPIEDDTATAGVDESKDAYGNQKYVREYYALTVTKLATTAGQAESVEYTFASPKFTTDANGNQILNTTEIQSKTFWDSTKPGLSDGYVYKVKWIKESELKDGTNNAVTDPAKATNISKVTTDINGAALFGYLPDSTVAQNTVGTDVQTDGKYYLLETKAPVDYTKLLNPVEIEVDGSASTEPSMTAEQQDLILTNIANVANTPGSTLPSTGGVGATMMTIGGVALILAAGAFLVLRRRKEQE